MQQVSLHRHYGELNARPAAADNADNSFHHLGQELFSL